MKKKVKKIKSSNVKVKTKRVSKKVKKESVIVETVKQWDGTIPLGKCCSCKKMIKDTDFENDVEGMKEFAKSGLCKRCQFEEEDDE